jgi:hypothetical protein
MTVTLEGNVLTYCSKGHDYINVLTKPRLGRQSGLSLINEMDAQSLSLSISLG